MSQLWQIDKNNNVHTASSNRLPFRDIIMRFYNIPALLKSVSDEIYAAAHTARRNKLQCVCIDTKAPRGFARGKEKTQMRVRGVQTWRDNARESLGPEIP